MSESSFDYIDLLEAFLWGLDCLSKPTMGNMLRGYEAFAHDPLNRDVIRALEKRRYLRREKRGREVVFRLTAAGARHLWAPAPGDAWKRPWDGRWRMVVFDIPELRRRDRQVLQRAFHRHRLGRLQRSVWVWPHPLEALVTDLLEADGIPASFCGLDGARLFLCTDQQVVTAAWNWPEITRRHRLYLEHPTLSGSLRSVGRRPLPEVLTLARLERELYRDAFAWDPLLPRRLWPRSYQGERVERRHRDWRAVLAPRLTAPGTRS